MRGAVAAALALAIAATAPTVVSAQNGDRVVRKLDFEGNRAIPDEVLATAIATTRSSWFARNFLVRWLGIGEKRYFDEQEFRRDVVRLEVFYRRSGYPHVQLDTLVQRTPQNVYITFKIAEGEPTRVTGLTVTGLDSLPEKIRAVMLVDLPLRQGDPFNRYVMQVTADTVTRRLRDRGYPSAKVYSSFETNKDANTATISMEVDPGAPAVIGTVTVDGTKRVEPSLVRKLLVSRPGRTYSQDELFQSQRNLYGSDLFRFANVNIDSASFTPGADSVPLLVQ
ncbi:MAG TPA: POTRA domain-containing protein, partial [Gemmatimonadales bacterium]